jgi:hypothetical protein
MSVTVEPTTWPSASPLSSQSLSGPWHRREDKNSTWTEFKLAETRPKADWILEDVPFALGSWADSDSNDDEDDDAPPPATAVSAPAGTVPVQSTNNDLNLRYVMVLIDVSHVKVSTKTIMTRIRR